MGLALEPERIPLFLRRRDSLVRVEAGERQPAAPPPSPLVLASVFRSHLLNRVADQIVGADRGELMYIPGYQRPCYRHMSIEMGTLRFLVSLCIRGQDVAWLFMTPTLHASFLG